MNLAGPRAWEGPRTSLVQGDWPDLGPGRVLEPENVSGPGPVPVLIISGPADWSRSRFFWVPVPVPVLDLFP